VKEGQLVVSRVKVRLFHELRSSVGQSEIELEADTINDVLQSLVDKHGGVKELLFQPNGQLRPYVMFYVNNSPQNPPDLSRKLNDGDLVLLVPPAAGGA
jgi:molybdopterin synthase sulfur carrier subunit